MAKKFIVDVTRLWLAGMIEECDKRGITSFLVAVVKGKSHYKLTCEILESKIRPKFVTTGDSDEEIEEADQSAEIEALTAQLAAARERIGELELLTTGIKAEKTEEKSEEEIPEEVELAETISDILEPGKKEHDTIIEAIDHEVIDALKTVPDAPIVEKRGPGRPPANKDKK